MSESAGKVEAGEGLPPIGSVDDLLGHVDDVATLHPSLRDKVVLFSYAHLPAHLQKVSASFARLAVEIVNGPRNSETTIALDKLREAKDRAVTAHVL